jgi:hypothetical protein
VCQSVSVVDVLLLTAFAIGGGAFYAAQYRERWIWLVFGLVWFAFTGWRWLHRRADDQPNIRP